MPSFALRHVIGFFCILTCLASVRAELKWDYMTQNRDAQPGEPAVSIPFKFTNESKQALTITDVRTNCSCTTATVSKQELAPGEQGELNAVLTVGERRGLQTKQILVVTDAEPTKPVVLTIAVTIHAPATLRQSSLEWAANADPVEKSLTVATQPGTQLAIEPLSAREAKALTAEIKPSADGKSYVLTVTPRDTSAHFFGSVRLSVVHPKATQAPLYVAVKIN